MAKRKLTPKTKARAIAVAKEKLVNHFSAARMKTATMISATDNNADTIVEYWVMDANLGRTRCIDAASGMPEAWLKHFELMQ